MSDNSKRIAPARAKPPKPTYLAETEPMRRLVSRGTAASKRARKLAARFRWIPEQSASPFGGRLFFLK